MGNNKDSEDNEDKWSFLKYTSHNWSADRERRLFASNESDINQLYMYLEQVYNKRLLGQSNEGEGKKSIPIEEIYNIATNNIRIVYNYSCFLNYVH